MSNQMFLTLVFLCAFTHIIRAIYEILKHRKLLRPDKISFVIVFFNMVLLWTSWSLLCRFDNSGIEIPMIIRLLGISFVIIGIILFLIALFTIKTLETYAGDLITKGIYSKIRHPMYLGFLLWLIGLPVFYGGVYSFLLSVPFIVNVLFWRYLEELELEKRFTGYKKYKLKTFF